MSKSDRIYLYITYLQTLLLLREDVLELILNLKLSLLKCNYINVSSCQDSPLPVLPQREKGSIKYTTDIFYTSKQGKLIE